MGIPDNVNLGRKGKFGQVNLNGFQGGLKKSDIKSAEIKNIFDKFDINKDGTLSQEEIQKLKESLESFAQNGRITKHEARKFLKQNGLKGEANKKDVFNFLNTIESFTKSAEAQQPAQPEIPMPELVIPESKPPVPQKVPEIAVTPDEVVPDKVVPEEPTMQDLLAQKLGANGKTSALIDGKSTGLGKDYTGQIRLPNGQKLEEGKFPKMLRMSLPATYGPNAAMTLTLVDEENGIYESSAHDRRFQVAVDENGNVTVKSVDVEELQGKLNANLETYARIEEEKARLEAEKITGTSQNEQVKQGNSITNENIIYQIDSQGNVKYINKQTGQELTADEAKAFVQTESKAITDKLTKAADYFWGTDIPLMQEGVGNIYSKDILENVNTQLKAKGFGELKDDGKVVGMPLENLLLDEESHDLVLGHLKTLINKGVMTPQEAARSIKREMEYEVDGGLGITRSAKVETIMDLVPDRQTRIELENQFKADNSHKNLKENEGSLVRAYLAADGWKPDEVDRFDSYWVQNKVYDESVPEDLEHAKGVVGRLMFEHGTDNDFENQIRAGQALDPESKVYAYVKERAAEENKKAGYGAQFKGQNAVQQYIAGKTADGGKVDSARVAAFNNGLYKGEKPIDIQAQEVLYDVKSGDFTHAFDSMDPKLYAEIDKMIQNGEVDGVKSMDELYQKTLSANTRKMSIKANALLAGTIKMSDEELTNFCVNLMHNIDYERGQGGSTGKSASHINNADFNTVQLKAILQNNPQILAGLKERVENGEFKTQTTTQEIESMAEIHITDTKADYLKIIADTRYSADEAVFYDNNGKQVTDKRVIKHITENNMKSLDLMRQYVAQLERDHKMEVDKQGKLSGWANSLSEYSGLGTDRSDVATRYNDAKQLLARMEIAAQGKLRDVDGNVISLQDLAKEAVAKENELAQTNSDYVSTIQTGKMAIVMAPVIAATVVASGGAAAVGLGTIGTAAVSGAATAATTYGMNALEYNTSQTGNTASARENNAIESLIAGTTTFIGAEQMPFIGKMFNNASTIVRGGGRLTTVLASDIGVGAAGEYVQTGQITVNGVAMNAVFSATGNLIGLKSLAKKADVPAGASPEVLSKATNDGQSISGGTLNKEKFNKAMEQARNVSAEDAPEMYRQADLHQASNRSQGRQLKQEILDAHGVESHGKELVAGNSSGQKIVEQINSNTANSADAILANKNGGALAPHDAATLDSHLVNNLNTKEEIELFKQQLRERVGVDGNGNMFKYEVQGKDMAADLIAKADKKLKQLADFENVLQTIPDNGGIGDMTSLKAFVHSPSASVEQLETILNKMKSNSAIKSFGGSKKLMTEIEDLINVKKLAKSEPSVNAKPADETPATPKSDETPATPKADETPAAPKADETPAAPKADTPEIIEPKANEVKAVVNDIDVAMPPALKGNWGNCKNKINSLMNEMKNFSGDIKALGAKCKAIFAEIDTLAGKVSSGIKVKLNQIKQDIKEMFNSIRSSESIKDTPETPKAETPAAPKAAANSKNPINRKVHTDPIQQSNSFNKTHHIDADTFVADGYRDGGRRLKFDDNGNLLNSPSREIIVVDRKQDKQLQRMINDIKSKTKNMSPKEKAAYLQKYVCEISGGKSINENKLDVWEHQNVGKEILLGDIITSKPHIAVCRHRSLLYKILGDEIDLNVSLQRGNFYDALGGGGHAWNTVEFDDGTSAIFDAMHNKTSNTTPGHVDDYAKQYTDVSDNALYIDGLKSRYSAAQVGIPHDKEVGNVLQRNESAVVSPNAKLKLGGEYELDLASPDMQARLSKLNDGESIIIGRNHGIPETYSKVSREHLIITKQGDQIIVKDISTNGTTVADMPAVPKANGTKLPEINSNELVREAGNGGKKVDAGYIRASQEARAYLNDAIETGNYTESFESYVNTINNMHKVSVGDGWYDKVGQGSNGVEPGVIRNEGVFRNRRIGEAQWVQKVAKKYGDKYNPMAEKSVVNLKGIPDEYKPSCINFDKSENGYMHFYPDGKSMKYYYTEMHRTAKEALNLINSGASEKQILAKLAEHYQYAANARPYSQINNSLFMNEINTLLHKAGLKGMPHGMLDHAAQRLQPDTFQKYFIDEYYRTAV